VGGHRGLAGSLLLDAPSSISSSGDEGRRDRRVVREDSRSRSKPQPREEVAHSINVADWASIVRPPRRAILTARPVRSARPSKPHGRQRLLPLWNRDRHAHVGPGQLASPQNGSRGSPRSVGITHDVDDQRLVAVRLVLEAGAAESRTPGLRSVVAVAKAGIAPKSPPWSRRLGPGVGALVADQHGDHVLAGLSKSGGRRSARRRR
jgi:hypothetical protein